ncbi:basal body-orientation factor 1 [Mergus octosetaceus]
MSPRYLHGFLGTEEEEEEEEEKEPGAGAGGSVCLSEASQKRSPAHPQGRDAGHYSSGTAPLQEERVVAWLAGDWGLLGPELQDWALPRGCGSQAAQKAPGWALAHRTLPCQQAGRPAPKALVQYLGLGLVDPDVVHLGSLLHPVHALSDGISSFFGINRTTELGVICKLGEGALKPIIYVTGEVGARELNAVLKVWHLAFLNLVQKRLEEDAEKKLVMMTETAQREAVLQLNSMGREVFKENIRLQGAFSYNLKEKMELQKTKQKLEEDKILLLLEKETSKGLIRKKILQINHQKAQIRDLQCKVEKLEMALSHMTREFETKTQKTQHQAVIENQASMVEIKKLQQLLEMKDQEMNRMKKLAQNILNERTEVERFFLGALEHAKQEIIASRKHYYERARAAYYRKMMEACAGTEEFPKIKTFKGNINSTNSVYRDLEEAEKCYWKYSTVLATSAPADAKEESEVG